MKAIRLLAVFLFVLLLWGCTGEPEPAMYIQPAQLTEEETAIADLLALDMDQRIFDFQVDDTVQVMDIRAYEWIDGVWDPFIGGSGGGMAHTDTQGRIALDFDKIPEGLRMAVQSDHHNGATGITREPMEELKSMSCATSLLSEKTEIVYEQEIPLAIQIITSKNEIHSYDTSYFFEPEAYAQYGHEHVYAITVVFSQEPLS